MMGIAGTCVKALARQYGMGQVVRHPEKLPEGSTSGLWPAVVSSVRPEPLPTVSIESISLRVPVVGSGLGGILEIADEYGAAVAGEDSRGCGKVLDSRYDREEMRRYAFKKFCRGNEERSLFL